MSLANRDRLLQYVIDHGSNTYDLLDAERARIIDALRAATGIGSAAEAVAVVEALGGYGSPPARICLECGEDIPAKFEHVHGMTSCSFDCADAIARRHIEASRESLR